MIHVGRRVNVMIDFGAVGDVERHARWGSVEAEAKRRGVKYIAGNCDKIRARVTAAGSLGMSKLRLVALGCSTCSWVVRTCVSWNYNSWLNDRYFFIADACLLNLAHLCPSLAMSAFSVSKNTRQRQSLLRCNMWPRVRAREEGVVTGSAGRSSH